MKSLRPPKKQPAARCFKFQNSRNFHSCLHWKRIATCGRKDYTGVAKLMERNEYYERTCYCTKSSLCCRSRGGQNVLLVCLRQKRQPAFLWRVAQRHRFHAERIYGRKNRNRSPLRVQTHQKPAVLWRNPSFTLIHPVFKKSLSSPCWKGLFVIFSLPVLQCFLSAA